MSQVTVAYNARQVKIKCTPGTLLSEIQAKACTTFDLDTNAFELRRGRTALDLTLPFRFSNLVANAKIDLVARPKSQRSVANKSVTIKLIVTDLPPQFSEKLVEQFPTSSTLWQILKHFEKKSGINITQRAVPQKLDLKSGSGTGRLFYEFPVVQTFAKVYTELEDYNQPLSAIGMTSGNNLLRLRFETTDKYFEDMIEIQAAFSEGTDNMHQNPKGSVEVNSDQKLISTDSFSPSTVTPIGVVAPDTADISTTTPTDSAVPTDAAAPTDAATLTETASSTTASLNSPSPSVVSDQIVSTSSKFPEIGPSNRRVQIYVPSSSQASLPSEEEQDYDMTLDQAKLYQGMLSSQAANLSGPLLTRNLREKAEQEKKSHITSCDVRIRLPDQVQLQATFKPNEKVKDIVDFVKSKLSTPQYPFNLFMNPPKRFLDKLDNELVKDYAFGHRNLVYFEWDSSHSNSHSFPTSNILSTDSMAVAKSIDEALVQSTTSSGATEQLQASKISKPSVKPQNNSSARPKWFKLGK